MYETEALILCVQEHPCLWNTGHADYLSREHKDLAWEQVLRELVTDYDCFDDEEKKKKGYEMKRKWANIRDSYRKAYKKRKTSSRIGSKINKRYVYAELLSFLDPILWNRKEVQDECSNDMEEEEDFKRSPAVSPNPSPPPPKPIHKKIRHELPSEVLEIVMPKTEKTEISDREDDDTKFLLSFRSDMRSMSRKQKIEFKMGMLQLVSQITENNDIPSSSSW